MVLSTPFSRIYYSGNFGNGLLNAGTKCQQKVLVVRKQLDLDGFRRVGEIANHILQNLRELHIERWLSRMDLFASIGNHFIDVARTVRLQANGEVPGIRPPLPLPGPSAGRYGAR